MEILDFSKAFETVSHSKLLYKLNHYGVRNNTLQWISSWLTGRTQKVVINGKTSEEVRVKLGVPQGTVLAPAVFTFYKRHCWGNEIIRKTIRRRCLLFRTIDAIADSVNIQMDLDRLCQWAPAWQMRFNEKKCYILQISNKKDKKRHVYSMNGIQLEVCSHNPYLGVELQDDLKWNRWNTHIGSVTSKANTCLGFRRLTWQCVPKESKSRLIAQLCNPTSSIGSLGSILEKGHRPVRMGPETRSSFYQKRL